MPKIAALDFGLNRIGLALSDEMQFLATPVGAIKTLKDLKETARSVLKELEAYQPLTAIVLGLPIHMNGRESPLSLTVRLFAKELEELTSLPLILWDERLTTAQSERMLKEAHLTRKKRSQCIDAVSAAAILQNYMDAHDTRIPF